MKTTIAVAVVFVCLLLAGVPAPGQGDSGVKEAQTLDQLLERYSDETCRNCHGVIHEEWKESFHARSVMHSLGGLRNFIVVGIRQEWRRDVTKGDLMKCFHCHAPMLYDASEELVMKVAGLVVSAADEKDPRRKEDAQKELSRLTVNCVICHNTVVHRPSQGWLGKTERDTMYGTKVVKAPHRTAQSTIIGSSLFCGQCHGTYNPPDSDTVFCNTLHESYLNAYIPAGGLKTCQQCHMTKERGHRFPGAYDAAMVRQGLEFEAEAVPYRQIQGSTWVPRIVATVNIFNRAGHRVPDGWPWTSKVVLDVTTRDGRGEVVFSARKEYVQYGQDIDGDLRYGAWQIKKFTDFTLQPFQVRTERFVIPLAEGTKQAEVEMALTYLHPGAKTEVPIHRVVRKLDIRE